MRIQTVRPNRYGKLVSYCQSLYLCTHEVHNRCAMLQPLPWRQVTLSFSNVTSIGRTSGQRAISRSLTLEQQQQVQAELLQTLQLSQ